MYKVIETQYYASPPKRMVYLVVIQEYDWVL